MAYMNQKRKKVLAPAIKAVLKEFGMKGSIAVNNHSTLVVNIKEGPIDFGDQDYIQINPYWIEEHYEGVAQKFLVKLLAAMKGTMWYDNSNAMIDYFDTAYYTDINVGLWNKPYVCN